MNLDLLKKAKLLYIEDDKEVVGNITKTLNIFFEEIHTAYNGKDALELFDKERFSIVITDIDLPHINGVEIIKNIRLKNLEIPIIVTTSYDDKETLKSLIPLGITEFILKPLSFPKLSQSFKSALNILERTNQIYLTFPNGTVYDSIKNLIINSKNPAKLTKKEQILLKILYEKRNSIVTYEALENQIWDDLGEHRESLKTYISNVRKIVGKESIENIQDLGYKLIT
ncbi:MAG: response regulator transcription factor [Campylobacterales bacterium]|nr:response regulator transcription factor [Campylobacterales bacterium]